MPDLRIVPISVGRFRNIERSGVLHLVDAGTKIDIVILVWLIEGAGKKILVDTGWADQVWKDENAPQSSFIGQPDEEISAALRKNGVTPDEIEIVINTHLHTDHCFQNCLFQNARFFVQRDELAFAIAPVSAWQAFAYDSPLVGLTPRWMETLPRMELIEGDVEIVPGVTAVSLPGHTPGSQGILVETRAGKYLIAGDTISQYENWEPRVLRGRFTAKHTHNGLFTDLEAYYRTFDKIEKIADHILPGHDFKVLEKSVYP